MLTLTPREWARVFEKIRTEYVSRGSTISIYDSMKQDLRFTPRHHQHWVKGSDGVGRFESMICLDFYDDAVQSYFLLKYMNRD